MAYIQSSLTIRTLKEATKNTMFKTPINQRKKELGKIEYKGWSIEMDSVGSEFKGLATFYFLVESKLHKDKKTKKTKRFKYIQILQIPYKKSLKEKFIKIYDTYPVKIYSSDPSFKYYFAYVLNTQNAVVVNKTTKKNLGIALTKKPLVRNKKFHKEFNKHFYKLVEFISSKKVSTYMNDKTYLGMNKMPNISYSQ